MPLILLTGAGFSRNWGGWLANEVFEYLLGQDGLHLRTRELLWDHKERGTGFEGVYQALPPGLYRPIDGSFSVTDRHQPYFKLHGSSNWTLPDRSDLMLIIGGNKVTGINSSPLLSWYREQFRKLLHGARVVIIGYSFQDEHINDDLMNAAKTGARFFVVDPSGVDIIDKRKLAQIPQPREPLMETLMRNIDGASRRPLRSTFDGDEIEWRKLDHFMTADSRGLRP
ncbi:hypothetical protein ACVIHI_008738 [Bradyrhizobium sp. USDA 4524]|uniref:SIR2 family protein n=1 Tax=unclassified Bradyrhizobium TaxID=2631580 RepID=UPI0020A07E52|nr:MULTISPECIES: SIR2 family protein [unclassified Bradyrhizobium]MCP1845798.1 hypothetical protein [Bradyrhizobium sp. USDA 4538]MCP1906879.1 hypothetical protein [Bradyrhizobium sp. USDA 4537]MCP1985354.1 hypothetical protein [Bradyrhizobium sp. USDA 4539]